MRFELKDKDLTLYLEGELNSYNADNVEKEIDETLKPQSFEKLILDFSHISYISSAGLRIILKLKQKYNNLSVVETTLEVYDIFSMTGFTNIMDIKKGMKRVYLSGAQVIGDGYYSTVYRVDKDTIIKVFERVSDPEQIERELKLAKEAFVLGIPTAISFDIVRVDDGKLGVRYEMLDCMSLKNAYIEYPEREKELTEKYAALLKKMNTTECYDINIPDKKEAYIVKLGKIKQFLPDAVNEKLLKMFQKRGPARLHEPFLRVVIDQVVDCFLNIVFGSFPRTTVVGIFSSCFYIAHRYCLCVKTNCTKHEAQCTTDNYVRFTLHRYCWV